MSVSDAGAPPASYEFKEDENAEIRKTATWCGTWGLISIGLGSLAALAVIIPSVIDLGSTVSRFTSFLGFRSMVLATGIANTFVGAAFFVASKALRSVADTSGNDILNLMIAMSKLKMAFMVLTIGFMIVLSGWIIAGPAGLQ